jgi:hypothetical protein
VGVGDDINIELGLRIIANAKVGNIRETGNDLSC